MQPRFLLAPQSGPLLPPPALRERGHCGLSRLGITVCGRATFVVPEGYRPHPRRYRRRTGLIDATDNIAVGQHVIIFVPLTGCAARLSSKSVTVPSPLP